MEDDTKETFAQKASRYDFIRFTVADINGMSRGKVVPARNVAGYINKGPEWWTGKMHCDSNKISQILIMCNI